MGNQDNNKIGQPQRRSRCIDSALSFLGIEFGYFFISQNPNNQELKPPIVLPRVATANNGYGSKSCDKYAANKASDEPGSKVDDRNALKNKDHKLNDSDTTNHSVIITLYFT